MRKVAKTIWNWGYFIQETSGESVMNGVRQKAYSCRDVSIKVIPRTGCGRFHVFITCREWRKIDFKSQGESLRRGFRGKGSAAR